MNGTTSATSTLTFLGRARIVFKDSSTGASKALLGDVTATAGSVIGVIPAGYRSGTSEIDIGAEATLGGSTTISLPNVAPAGVTFSRPRTEAGKIVLNNGTGTLTNGQANAVWSLWTLVAGMSPYSSVDIALRGKGDAV